MKIYNVLPFELQYRYTMAPDGIYDPLANLYTQLCDPLFATATGQPVAIYSDDGTLLTSDFIRQLCISGLGSDFLADIDASLKELFAKAMLHVDDEYRQSPLMFNELALAQCAKKEGLPLPNQKTVFYIPEDVIDASKRFLAGKCNADTLIASYGLYGRLNTLGVYFRSENEFNDFKQYLRQYAAPYKTQFAPDTGKMIQSFMKLKLADLNEAIRIRANDSDQQNSCCFARMLVSALMDWLDKTGPDRAGLIPFNLGELYNPQTLTFLNVDSHAHSTAASISQEFSELHFSLTSPVVPMSLHDIYSLNTMTRNGKKIQGAAANAESNAKATAEKSSSRPFRKSALNPLDIAQAVSRLMNQMKQVLLSHNYHINVKSSYMRPNRRHPEDFNLSGKVRSRRYLPDLHLYIDTSGSISEENYKEAMQACIMMAKKLNINLYFNSFSHIISKEALIHCENASLSSIYRQFARIPKVSGGTDYEKVWKYINAKPKRRREISIMVTDFEYAPPNRAVNHPKNLYYLPCSKMDWRYITQAASEFVKNMEHADPSIRQKLLF